MDKVKVTKDLEAKTLIIEREFAAPADKLWQAYADEATFAKWWGPEGWQTTVKEFTFAPGGRNLYTMKCVDENQGEWFGQESWGLMKYVDIQAPLQFTYEDYFANPDGSVQQNMPVVVITIEFDAQGEKTNLVTRIKAETTEEIEKLVEMGMVEGFSSSCDKLEALLNE